jgi:hypothetical protein
MQLPKMPCAELLICCNWLLKVSTALPVTGWLAGPADPHNWRLCPYAHPGELQSKLLHATGGWECAHASAGGELPLSRHCSSAVVVTLVIKQSSCAQKCCMLHQPPLLHCSCSCCWMHGCVDLRGQQTSFCVFGFVRHPECDFVLGELQGRLAGGGRPTCTGPPCATLAKRCADCPLASCKKSFVNISANRCVIKVCLTGC